MGKVWGQSCPLISPIGTPQEVNRRTSRAFESCPSQRKDPSHGNVRSLTVGEKETVEWVLSFASSQVTFNLITSEEKSIIRVLHSCFHLPAKMVMFQIFWLNITEIDLKTCSFCLNKLLSLLFLSLFRTRENFPWGAGTEPHAWSGHLTGVRIISRIRLKEPPVAISLTSRFERPWRNNFWWQEKAKEWLSATVQ